MHQISVNTLTQIWQDLESNHSNSKQLFTKQSSKFKIIWIFLSRLDELKKGVLKSRIIILLTLKKKITPSCFYTQSMWHISNKSTPIKHWRKVAYRLVQL